MTAAKSAPATRMDEVQALLDPILTARGFKRFQRTYNRSREKGVVQVVNFQMGRFDPPRPEPSPIPEWMRPNLYGRFTINLGVYVEEVAQTIAPHKGRYVIEPECMIRIRIGELVADQRDCWWQLDQPAALLTAEVNQPLFAKGIPMIEKFESRDTIIADWMNSEFSRIHSPRAKLDIGIILAKRGDLARATEAFKDHLNNSRFHPNHVQYVLSLAQQLGLALPLPQ